MALNFPNNPALNEQYTASNNIEYIWDGQKWITVGSANADNDDRFVLKTGDTMTGTLVVPTLTVQDDISVTDLASIGGDAIVGGTLTAGHVNIEDNLNDGPLAGFRNQIINGDFRINQRSVQNRYQGFGVYGFDRWKGGSSGTIVQIIEDLPDGRYTLSWEGGGIGGFGNNTGVSPITGLWDSDDGNCEVTVPTNSNKVQLEFGDYATHFESRPIATEQALCDRYYQQFDMPTSSSGYGDAADRPYTKTFLWRSFMRVTPSVDVNFSNGVNVTVEPVGINRAGCTVTGKTDGPGYSTFVITLYSADAEL